MSGQTGTVRRDLSCRSTRSCRARSRTRPQRSAVFGRFEAAAGAARVGGKWRGRVAHSSAMRPRGPWPRRGRRQLPFAESPRERAPGERPEPAQPVTVVRFSTCGVRLSLRPFGLESRYRRYRRGPRAALLGGHVAGNRGAVRRDRLRQPSKESLTTCSSTRYTHRPAARATSPRS